MCYAVYTDSRLCRLFSMCSLRGEYGTVSPDTSPRTQSRKGARHCTCSTEPVRSYKALIDITTPGEHGFPPCSNMVSSFIYFSSSLCAELSQVLANCSYRGDNIARFCGRRFSPLPQNTPSQQPCPPAPPMSFIHGLGCRKTPNSAHHFRLVICKHTFLNRPPTPLRSAASNDRAAIVRSPPSPLRQPIVCRSASRPGLVLDTMIHGKKLETQQDPSHLEINHKTQQKKRPPNPETSLRTPQNTSIARSFQTMYGSWLHSPASCLLTVVLLGVDSWRVV